MAIKLPPVYPITPDSFTTPELLAWCSCLLEVGCPLLQYRRKKMGDGERFSELLALLALAEGHRAKVIVDDRPDLCLLAQAAGVHLGQDDLPPAAVRAFLGRDCLLGFSTHSEPQARAAFDDPVDYLALGPVFPTESRENPSPVVLEAVQETILAASPFPLVAIGGITPERAVELWNRGFACVAVIGALTQNPVAEWNEFLRAFASVDSQPTADD